MFLFSLILVVVYAFIFHKHFNVNLTILTVLVPIINMGFVLMGTATIVEEALIALRLTYLGGCYVLVSAMLLILETCGLNVRPWMRTAAYVISTAIYATTLTIGKSDIFYVGKPELAFAYGAAYITNKHYGFMHTIFYVMVGIFYAITVAALIYSFFKKKQVPITILVLIALAITISVFGFFGGRLVTHSIELLPATYNLGMVVYLIIASRLRLYDPSDSVIDSLVQKGDTGFISFDNKMRFLGCNDTAREMMPELSNLRVDRSINENAVISNILLPWVKEFEKDPENTKHIFERNNRKYLVNLNKLMIGRFHRGYQFFITDDTANQQYIALIKNYNDELEKEVEKKTEHIIEMQNKLVMGMATMVEGRDNSTGGHIKRTSDCIRILVEEMKKDNIPGMDEEFCIDLIKAAPMHDLGKIAVDDKILRKPGKYTPEEFEIMKTHAEEGAKILRKILKDTDDKRFAEIAINVAHYHHERWDGSGYPHKLIGEEIPLEARIMAVADVYDALVSKRVYKDKMSFEEANAIILEGMGKHFDKRLEPYYLRARAKLEEYYRNTDC